MSLSLDAPLRLVFADGRAEELEVGELFTFLLDALEALVSGEERYSHPLLAALNDVVRVEGEPETWAVLLWCIGDALHRQ